MAVLAPPLQSTSPKFVASLAQASTMEFFQPCTNIIFPKERAANFYYVLSGALQSLNADGKPLRLIKKGFTFGGPGVFCEVPQVCDLIRVPSFHLTPHSTWKIRQHGMHHLVTGRIPRLPQALLEL